PRAVLEVIAGHPRWSVRAGVRSALLRNPGLPGPLALSLLTRATREDLEGLAAAPGIPRFLRLCAQRVLAQRGREDYDQPP
ncbi:MAG: hypothetical protein ACRD00_07365, partial [Thermoanaerobaculia bacterium]